MKSPPPSPRPGLVTIRRVLALVAAIACGWAAYSLYGAAAEDRALAAGVAHLQSANTTLQQQIAERTVEIREAQGPAWIEEQARRLGFHLPGETIYVVVPTGDNVPRSGGINAPLPSYSPRPSPTPTASAAPTPAATPSGGLIPLQPGTPSPSPTPRPSPSG